MAPLLIPGDLLMFDRAGWINTWIKLKTWSDVSHVEVYRGNGKTWASRAVTGINVYPLDLSGLKVIMRPEGLLDWKQGVRWMALVKGQGYDYLGLLAFYYAKWQGRETLGMFCSEFATRLYRELGVEPFQPDTDADGVAPSSFYYSARFRVIWRA